MEYTEKNVKIHFRVMAAAQGNGSANCKIYENGKLVFYSYGSYMSWCSKVETYIPGEWEKVILS